MTDRAAKWYEAYAGELTGFIQSKGFTLEDAEDICAQVFVEAVRKQDQWHDTAPRALLFSIAKSRMADWWRAANRRRQEELQDQQSDVNTEALAIDRVTTAQLRGLIGRLPTKQRDLIYFRFVEGRSLQEVAAGLGISVKAAKSRQLRAKGSLRKLIDTPPEKKIVLSQVEPVSEEPYRLDARSVLLLRCLRLEQEVYEMQRALEGTQ